ncbi:hypothetical protein [Streptomyces sp. A0592]|uniref:hypothetical protein n=1 Tax=Streptomyces sp. A0592 TaxID=2563099 RepID=UPI00109EB7F3|nr:hypothetical protein [Streptomyces sp. A0592]THA78898.1 hypothetical protein E6U81_32200 [Streptomyces sp. A0592]
MPRRTIARRPALLVAAGAALLLTAAPLTPASAAVGDIQVVLGEPGKDGPLMGSPIKLVRSPADGHCYTVKEVFPDAPDGSYFRSVSNHTNASVFVYEADACAGAPRDRTPMEPGKVIINVPIHSFKVTPSPDLPLTTPSPPAG